jgi:predicted nuclease of predicted toxin-antitoxin system
VRPLDFPLLTDENIGPEVVAGLRDRGCDVRTARDEQLIGRPDTEVLQRAASQQRVVVTHDLAFGRATLRDGATFVGIVYLRPGHSPAEGQTRRRQPHRIDPFQDRAPLAARH